MGKIFIERLLRNTEVDKIYILIRPKKGKQPEERIKALFEDLVSSINYFCFEQY